MSTTTDILGFQSPFGDKSLFNDPSQDPNSPPVRISNVTFKSSGPVITLERLFTMTVTLNRQTDLYRAEAQVHNKIFQAYKKADSYFLPQFTADINLSIVVVPLAPLPQQNYNLVVRLIHILTGEIVNKRVIDTRTINPISPQSKKLTKAQLDLMFTAADEDSKTKVLDAFNEGVEYFEIDNCLRKAHFFAQVLKEVGSNFSIHTAESLNYPTDGLINGSWYPRGKDWVKGSAEDHKGGYYNIGTGNPATINFGYIRSHPEIAKQYGRKDLNRYGDSGVQRADDVMLANYVYSEQPGNGGPEMGDGSRFRGKGLIQLTGRLNYTSVNAELQKIDKTIDIVSDPDSVLGVRIAVLSAMAYWKINRINKIIGTNKSDDIADAVSRIVNRNEESPKRAVRRQLYSANTKIVFEVANCNLK